MSYALIDNASLTAAQRLLGRIETRGSHSTDGDIVAFEHLVQAILFYHEVVCIDDYKPEHRLSRERDFSFIRFINPREFSLDAIEIAAGEEARKFKPEIRGGSFADEDFRNVFEQLKLNIVCTWDISSSVYFLTMKMLGNSNTEEFSKYSSMGASILNELADQAGRGGAWNTDVALIDSSGRPISEGYAIEKAKWPNGGKTGGLTSGLKAFVAALHWLAGRTIYYSFLARHLRADTFLHPIRSTFQLHYMQKTGVFGYDFTHALLQSFDQRTQQTLASIVSGPREIAIKLDMPLFSGWLVNETGDIRTVLASALSLRNQQEFVDARYQVLQIREAVDVGDLKAANTKAQKISEGLNKTLQEIQKKYGVKSAAGVPLSPIVKTFNMIAGMKAWPKLPDLNTKLPLPDFLQKALSQKGIVQVYRNIATDLPAVWRLGDARKKLAAAIRKSDEPAFSPKTEQLEFRHVHSEWKSPM